MASTRTEADERPGRRGSRGAVRQGSGARRWILPALMAVVTAVVLVLYFSPLLGVRAVQVVGNPTLSTDAVLRAAGVRPGTPMLQVDASDVQQNLSKLPKVADSAVSLDWPWTVRIEVTERTPALYFRAPDGVHLVDAHGVGFDTAPTPPKDTPELQVPKLTPEITSAVLGVLGALPPQVRGQVVAIAVPGPGSVRLQLTGDRAVEWGTLRENQRKAAILPPLLTRPGKTYDVTTPELPTVS